MSRPFRLVAVAAAAGLVALALSACSNGDSTDASANGGDANGGELEGTFGVAAGTCADEGVTEGSWFRMVQSGGTVEDGPFIANSDSPCGDTTWTPLSPGTDGGLTTGAYQSHPDPAFDDGGHGTASAIVQPQPFFAVAFAVATNATDPQTEAETSAPSVVAADDGTLTGDLSAFAAAWNGQHFNQGAPKPAGGSAEGTTEPTGTYDEASGAYSLQWTSLIVGGPFNGFTGVWHLEGNFTSGP